MGKPKTKKPSPSAIDKAGKSETIFDTVLETIKSIYNRVFSDPDSYFWDSYGESFDTSTREGVIELQVALLKYDIATVEYESLPVQQFGGSVGLGDVWEDHVVEVMERLAVRETNILLKEFGFASLSNDEALGLFGVDTVVESIPLDAQMDYLVLMGVLPSRGLINPITSEQFPRPSDADFFYVEKLLGDKWKVISGRDDGESRVVEVEIRDEFGAIIEEKKFFRVPVGQGIPTCFLAGTPILMADGSQKIY